jgi:hypothetical protein
MEEVEMRRLLLVLPLATLVFAVSSAAAAQSGNTAQGTVTAVSTASLSIEESKSGGAKATQTFTLDDRTEVYARGATRALKGSQRGPAPNLIGKGDQVSVTYQESGGTLHATEVRVTKKAAAK